MDETRYITIRIPKPSRRWLQFSLGTFLIVSLLAGVFFGLFGRRAARSTVSDTYAVVYNVADLVFGTPHLADLRRQPTVADFDDLITSIQETVSPKSWDVAGGPGAIETFPTNFSFVISQTAEIHDELVDFLKTERQARSAPPSIRR